MKKFLITLLIFSSIILASEAVNNPTSNEVPKGKNLINKEDSSKIYKEYFLPLDEKLIQEFAQHNVNIASIDKNTLEIHLNNINPDKVEIENRYGKYLTNKNNMKENKDLYNYIEQYLQSVDKVILKWDKHYKNAYENFVSTLDKNELGNYNYEKFKKENKKNVLGFYFMDNIKDNGNIKKIEDEVYKYSKTYEQNKYKEWAKRNNKKPLCGALEPYIYYPYAPQPQVGCLYTAPPGSLPIYVFQTVPGGVILTGSTRVMAQYGFSLNSIFLQTSQHFADNQRIHSFMGEFKGYYDYTTVLGARKRIYKFYRLGQKEIDANFTIPGQPFYFFQPY